MRDAAYRILQSAWSAWLRRRCARDLATVERFCLFVGYPRSGHSLVGALLNAHRHAVVAHELDVMRYVTGGYSREEIYRLLLWKDGRFQSKGRSHNGYDYTVPGQWQGRRD